jgi:hypothetical protein
MRLLEEFVAAAESHLLILVAGITILAALCPLSICFFCCIVDRFFLGPTQSSLDADLTQHNALVVHTSTLGVGSQLYGPAYFLV